MQIENRTDGLNFPLVTTARRIGYAWVQPEDHTDQLSNKRSIKNLIALSIIGTLGILTIGLAHVFANIGAQWAIIPFWAGVLLVFAPIAFQLRAKFSTQPEQYIWRADAETGAYYRVPTRQWQKAQTIKPPYSRKNRA